MGYSIVTHAEYNALGIKKPGSLSQREPGLEPERATPR